MALGSQIKTIEVQIAALKAMLKNRTSQSQKGRTLGDLRGLLKGKVLSTEEDIEKAKLRFEWEAEGERSP